MMHDICADGAEPCYLLSTAKASVLKANQLNIYIYILCMMVARAIVCNYGLLRMPCKYIYTLYVMHAHVALKQSACEWWSVQPFSLTSCAK